MRPYENKRLIESPDLGDIKEEGRKSSVGNLPGKGGDIRSNSKKQKRKQTRRTLKRADKAKTLRQINKED